MIATRALLISSLKRMGADGLCCYGCGCSIDDLAPCGEDSMDCVAAKLVDAQDEDYPHGRFVPMPVKNCANVSITNLRGSAIIS